MTVMSVLCKHGLLAVTLLSMVALPVSDPVATSPADLASITTISTNSSTVPLATLSGMAKRGLAYVQISAKSTGSDADAGR